MKKFQKIVSIFLGLFVTFFAFVGCSSGAKVSRVAKKLTTYSIDAVFCDSEKKITATEQVDFINNTETILSSVCFNLYGKAFSEDAKIKPYSKAKIDECFPNGINYGEMNIQEVFRNIILFL